jgi:hypothetical protein
MHRRTFGHAGLVVLAAGRRPDGLPRLAALAMLDDLSPGRG